MKKYKTVCECAVDIISKEEYTLSNSEIAENVSNIMGSKTTAQMYCMV